METPASFRTRATDSYDDIVNSVATFLWGLSLTPSFTGTPLEQLNHFVAMKEISERIANMIPLDGEYDVWIDAENHDFGRAVRVEPTGKKRWRYSCSTNTIWTSFDCGEVEADSIEEARKLALDKLTYDFSKANDVLKHCDITNGFSISFAHDCIEIEAMIDGSTKLPPTAAGKSVTIVNTDGREKRVFLADGDGIMDGPIRQNVLVHTGINIIGTDPETLTGLTEFSVHALAILNEHGEAGEAAYGHGDIDIVEDSSPNIVAWGLYGYYGPEKERLVIADFDDRKMAETWCGILTALTQRIDNPYGIFLMVEAARLHGLIAKDLEYDSTWEVAEGMYREFLASAFADLTTSEMDCIWMWARAEQAKMQPTPPIGTLPTDRQIMLAYTYEKLDSDYLTDHIEMFDTIKQAEARFDQVREKEECYSASICRIIKSTDY